MTVRVEVQVIGEERWRQLLRRAEKRGQDLKPVLRGPITNSIHQFFKRQFDSQGAVGGEPWAPLTPTTRALKQRVNRGGMGSLRFTNRMWASFTKRSGVDSVLNVTSQSLEVGSSDPKSVYHQKGWNSLTVFGRPRAGIRRVEPRRIVPTNLPRSLVGAWERFLVKHLEDV